MFISSQTDSPVLVPSSGLFLQASINTYKSLNAVSLISSGRYSTIILNERLECAIQNAMGDWEYDRTEFILLPGYEPSTQTPVLKRDLPKIFSLSTGKP